MHRLPRSRHLNAVALAGLAAAACGQAPPPLSGASVLETDADPLPFSPTTRSGGHEGAQTVLVSVDDDVAARRLALAFVQAVVERDEVALNAYLAPALLRASGDRGPASTSRAELIERLRRTPRGAAPLPVDLAAALVLHEVTSTPAGAIFGARVLGPGLRTTDRIVVLPVRPDARSFFARSLGWIDTGTVVVALDQVPRIVAL